MKLTNAELESLGDLVLDRLHEDFSNEERAEMIDKAIETTNLEFGCSREGDIRMSEDENLACDEFRQDPNSRFCDECGYSRADHRRPPKPKPEEQEKKPNERHH